MWVFLIIPFVVSLLWFLKFLDSDITLFVCSLWDKKNGPSEKVSNFSGKTVWIIGASSGIGEALAYEFAEQGAKVVLSARREAELDDIKTKMIDSTLRRDYLTLPFDVLDERMRRENLKAIMVAYGRVDILVLNAGRTQRAAFEDIDLQVDKDLFELNVFSQLDLARLVLPVMKKQGQGHIALTSSIAGVIEPPCSASYNASKHALHAYYDTLRFEMSTQGIDVTLLCPGPVATPALSVAFCGKFGQVYGRNWSPKERLSAKRCAELSILAIRYKLPEAWISNQPGLILCYLRQYFPSLYRIVMCRFAPTLARKFRDGE